jgi:hypothetical protein
VINHKKTTYSSEKR